MKKNILSLAVFASFSTLAQTSETVTLGNGYADQAWYALETGNATHASLNEFQLAFQTGNMGTGIRFNSAVGTLYKATEDTTQFLTLNTQNLSTLESFIDSDTSWSEGALNADNDGMFDLGWGDYDMTTHYIHGDQVYIVEMNNGDIYKLLISSLINGIYKVRIANADNSLDTYVEIDKNAYAQKSLVYLDLATQSVLDREPAADAWDFIFTKYTDNTINYGVTGVLQNTNVEIAQYDGIDPVSHVEDGTTAFSTHINTIGYDWKSFNGSGYDIVDDRAYYVKDVLGNYWKVIFTGTSGSSTGEFSFTKEKIGTANIMENSLDVFKLFPNPATDVLNVVVDTKEDLTLEVYNMAGSKLNKQDVLTGFTHKIINVSSLESGVYTLKLTTESGKIFIKKFVK